MGKKRHEPVRSELVDIVGENGMETQVRKSLYLERGPLSKARLAMETLQGGRPGGKWVDGEKGRQNAEDAAGKEIVEAVKALDAAYLEDLLEAVRAHQKHAWKTRDPLAKAVLFGYPHFRRWASAKGVKGTMKEFMSFFRAGWGARLELPVKDKDLRRCLGRVCDDLGLTFEKVRPGRPEK